jgi:hypothetical protein
MITQLSPVAQTSECLAATIAKDALRRTPWRSDIQ